MISAKIGTAKGTKLNDLNTSTLFAHNIDANMQFSKIIATIKKASLACLLKRYSFTSHEIEIGEL